MRTTLFIVLLLLASTAHAQVLYEPCVGPGCARKSCLTLDGCGTNNSDMDTSTDGCIEKQGDKLVSTGQPCAATGGTDSVSCTLPPAKDYVLLSTDANNALWTALPDCPSGALQFHQGSPSFFTCLAITPTTPNPDLKLNAKASDTGRTQAQGAIQDTEMQQALLCGGVRYVLHYDLVYQNNGGTNTVQVQFDLDGTSPTIHMSCSSVGSDVSNTHLSALATLSDKLSIKKDSVHANARVFCDGWVKTGTCSTTTKPIFITWKPTTSLSTTTVTLKAGSFMTAMQILN